MAVDTAVDAGALREVVRKKYREVTINPHGEYHFHTGRSRRGLATTPQWSAHCRMPPSNHSPVSPTHWPSAHCARGSVS